MINEETKQAASRRLKLIKGQIAGIERMIDNEKYCIDIINQLSAVRNALEKVSLIIMKRHIESCVISSSESPDAKRQEQKMDELMQTLYKFIT
ncbi:MAG: metal-sensitive transcriptional regulator [Calditrichaeota bacterium]|nr:MAG: metal-sensitive transcriptional regulator [Calditrichota bacterium]